MQLPLYIVSFLPKKYKDRHVQRKWDNKTDESIRIAFKDASEWIALGNGSMSTPTIRSIADDCKVRLVKFILPQMIKRRL